MSEKAQTEVTGASYADVSVDHPSIAKATMNLAKQGVSKERAQQIVGMPREVIDRYYRQAESEK